MADRYTVFPKCLMVFVNLEDNFLRKVQIEVVSFNFCSAWRQRNTSYYYRKKKNKRKIRNTLNAYHLKYCYTVIFFSSRRVSIATNGTIINRSSHTDLNRIAYPLKYFSSFLNFSSSIFFKRKFRCFGLEIASIMLLYSAWQWTGTMAHQHLQQIMENSQMLLQKNHFSRN